MIRILRYEEITDDAVGIRKFVPEAGGNEGVEKVVSSIIDDVRKRGDEALFEYIKRFDGADIEELQVTDDEIREAVAGIDEEFTDILETAAANIRRFHESQVRDGFSIEGDDGIVMGQKVIPMETVGLYVPGGTAVYPSTVLMDSIPAKIAGCPQVVIVTPPGKDGKVSPDILAAAVVSGVDRIFKVGGAQAIAALAYGTETIPRVDKIVGPGNAYVAEAKRQVFGQVAIDMIAGPSEILIVADRYCDPGVVAADMLSQAEHDVMASAVLLTDSQDLAEAVSVKLEEQLKELPRREIATASIENRGRIIIVPDLKKAVEISNKIAPEHLELCVEDPFELLEEVRNAGSVFLGRNCPEALGDYLAGPNHTLPTSGTARFSSPLSVDDFIKKTQFTYYTREALEKVSDKIETFAGREGLDAHGRSVRIRFDR